MPFMSSPAFPNVMPISASSLGILKKYLWQHWRVSEGSFERLPKAVGKDTVKSAPVLLMLQTFRCYTTFLYPRTAYPYVAEAHLEKKQNWGEKHNEIWVELFTP